MHNFALGQFPVDEVRPIKVVVIGAGYAGAYIQKPIL